MCEDIKSFELGGVEWKVGAPLYLMNIDNIPGGFIETTINSIRYCVDEDNDTGEKFWKYYSVRFNIKYDILGTTLYLKDELITILIDKENAPDKEIYKYIDKEKIVFGTFFISPSKKHIVETIKTRMNNYIIIDNENIEKEKQLIAKYEHGIVDCQKKIDELESLRL